MLIHRCRIKRWFGLFSKLLLCAVVMLPSLAIGGWIAQKRSDSQHNMLADVIQKKHDTQLKIVSATTASGQSLRRNTTSNLILYVEVQNTSKELQTFYLKAELARMPGVIEPSNRLVIDPLETKRFMYGLNRVNPGDRSGNFSGLVKIMNQDRQLVGESRTFTFRVVDMRHAEDLKVEKVEISRVVYASDDRGRSAIKRIEYWVKISNVGREIFGNHITLRTQLRTGKPDTGTQAISGGGADGQWDVRSGISLVNR